MAPRYTDETTISQELIQNSATLEKAALTLTESVNQLVDRIDRLLNLFEAAAKNIEKAEIKEPLAKQLETLLEQNKIIARGLVLIEKYIRDKTSVGFSTPETVGKQLPKML